MELLKFVQALEAKSDDVRLQTICSWLNEWRVPYQLQKYSTGMNLFVVPKRAPYIGISCHFDVVSMSPGANDNASAIAVVLELIRRNQDNPIHTIGLAFFFFDEEENGLRGSKAYVDSFGLEGMIGLYNLEMIGMGDQFALWSLDAQAKGKLLQVFEEQCVKKNIKVGRYDKIVTHYADHMSFKQAGLADSFSITCISQKGVEVAYHYYKAQEFAVDKQVLWEIMAQAPLFKHYHRPSDSSIHLNEQALQMTANVLWDVINALDQ